MKEIRKEEKDRLVSEAVKRIIDAEINPTREQLREFTCNKNYLVRALAVFYGCKSEYHEY